MFGSRDLAILEQPWVGGTTQDLLLRVIDDADLAGNSYWVDAAQIARAEQLEGVRIPGPQAELVRLRPDWVSIILAPRILRGGQAGWIRLGYVYFEGGARNPQAEPVAFLPDEVVHYAPIPDPLATYRGMSWLTPVIREIENDKQMGMHKTAFFRNAATPNLSVAMDKDVSLAAFQAFKAAMDAEHKGPDNAYKTLYLGGGADVKVIGADFQAMDFKSIQGHGETRIAAAGGVPPIIVGLSEGLSSATYSNYGLARRRFADGTMHPLWQNVAGCFANIVPRPTFPNGSGGEVRLWYDARDVPFLREDQRDAAQIQSTQAGAINQLITAGFTPESAVKAIEASDWNLLVHSGLVSVQLQPPGSTAPPATGAPTPTSKPKPEVTGE
jgi:phage portal protein BeeE